MGQKGGDELVRPGAARALVQALFESGDETLAVAREIPRGGRSRSHMDGLLSSGRGRRRGAARAARLLRAARAHAPAAARAPARPARRRGAGRAGAAPGGLRRGLRGGPDAVAPASGAARRRPRARTRDRHAALPDRRDRGGRRASPARTRSSPRSARGCVTPASCWSAPEARSASSPARTRPRRSTPCASPSAWSARRRRSTRRSRLAAERLDGLAAELDDLAALLRAYLDDLDVDPAHRDALELRYDRLKGLMRKYGDSADEVLAYAEESRAAARRSRGVRGRRGGSGGPRRRRRRPRRWPPPAA